MNNYQEALEWLTEGNVKFSETVDLMFFIRTSIEHNKQLGDNLKKQCLDYVSALELERENKMLKEENVVIKTLLANAYGGVFFIKEGDSYYMALDNYDGGSKARISKAMFDEAEKIDWNEEKIDWSEDE